MTKSSMFDQRMFHDACNINEGQFLVTGGYDYRGLLEIINCKIGKLRNLLHFSLRETTGKERHPLFNLGRVIARAVSTLKL